MRRSSGWTRELDSARMKSASSSTANIGDKVKDVKGVKVLAHRVDNLERAQMRTLVDQLRDKIGSGVVVLGSASNGNVALIVGVTKDLTGAGQAGKVIGPVAQKVGGKGGGRPDLAEAGGKDAAALDAALDGVYGVVEGFTVMNCESVMNSVRFARAVAIYQAQGPSYLLDRLLALHRERDAVAARHGSRGYCAA